MMGSAPLLRFVRRPLGETCHGCGAAIDPWALCIGELMERNWFWCLDHRPEGWIVELLSGGRRHW